MDSKQTNIHRLADGTVVRVRPVRPSDRRKLLAAFENFSPESRYRRFFSPTPRLTDGMLTRLLDLDGEHRVALGAEALRLGVLPGPGLGIARFTRSEAVPEVAEMAISIVDPMQGRGLGTVLLHELAAAARKRGVERFVAWVQPDNEAMKALVHKLDPDATSRVEDGLLVFEMKLPGRERSRTRAHEGGRQLVSLDPVGWLGEGLRQLLPGRLAPGRLAAAFARSR